MAASRSLRATVALLLLAAASFCITSTAPAQQLIPAAPDPSLAPYASDKDTARLPDGRAIHLVCMGQGSPTVILTAGAGQWSIDWNKVQPAIAARTRVCAWDRAGFGFSDASAKPQTVDNSTSDLEAALKAKGIAGPYVMVGHSLGGYESVLLKDRQPAKVVGMVLVDPAVPDQGIRFARATPAMIAHMHQMKDPFASLLRNCARVLRAGGTDPGCAAPQWPASYPAELSEALNKRSSGASPQTVAAVMETMLSSLSSVEQDNIIVIKADRHYGSMPLVVLTASDFLVPPDFPAAAQAEIPARQAEWRSAHDDYAALSTRGVNRMVSSDHAIHQTNPQAVIDAINEVLDVTRQSAHGKKRSR